MKEFLALAITASVLVALGFALFAAMACFVLWDVTWLSEVPGWIFRAVVTFSLFVGFGTAFSEATSGSKA